MTATFDTLFGGLVAVLVLYFLLGFARSLPPLFRALIAGGLPLFAYFAHLFGGVWPGLDVIAIHVSVFVAAAAVLFVLSRYRARHGRLHWAPRLFIAFFVLLALINATLLRISTQGLPEPIASWWMGGTGKVRSGFSGVVEHGEMAAKGISSGLAQRHAEAQLGWQVAGEGLLQDGPAQRQVVVRVRDRSGLPVPGLSATLSATRPGATDAARETRLAVLDDGVYGALLALPERGRWLVRLDLVGPRGERYAETRELVAP